MVSIIRRPTWHLPDNAATDENVFFNRREFLKAMGIGGMMAGGWVAPGFAEETVAAASLPLPKYGRNPKFADVGRALTEEYVGTTFNNFWEFTYNKSVVYAVEDCQSWADTRAFNSTSEASCKGQTTSGNGGSHGCP